MEITNQANYMNFSERIQDEDLTIKFYLLTNNDGELSDGMKIAYETLLDKVPIKSNIQLISEEQCLAMNPDELNEETVFIMEKFEGDAFQFIEDLKTVYILGVKTICTALQEQCTIPALYHIHNLSMKDFFVCFASFENKKEKAKLIKLVHYMGGYYSNGLKEITTHLVTNDIHSQKYYYANEHKMKIMKPQWVKDYWHMQQDIHFNVPPNDDSLDNYKLPIFNGIVACSTGIDITTKKHLIDVIENNGGEFSQTFKTATVNILFMTPKDLDSAKGKAAIKFRIKCAHASWVDDSIKAGYALPLNEKYLISPVIKASTPTKDSSRLGKFNFDNTMISDITAINSTAKHLTFEETQRSTRTSVARTSSIEIQQSAIIQKRVTEKSIMHSSNRQVRASSLNVKNDTFKKPPAIRPSKLSNISNSRHTVNVHEKENIQEPQPLNESVATEDRSYIQVFTGLNVFIYGYSEEEDMLQIMSECEKLGGNVVDVSYKKTVDYIITPANLLTCDEPKMKHKYIVNDLWLEECVDQGKLITDFQLHHFSIFKSYQNPDVLKGELFVLSNYDKERQAPYIKLMISLLGGQSKDELNKNREAILLSPKAEGKKYEGAIRWDFTVLKGEWLYECMKNSMRCDETPFLVGESKPSKHNKKNQRASIIPFSQGTPPIENEPELMEVEQNDYENEPVLPKRVAELRPRNIDSPKTPGTPVTPNKSMDDGILSISDLVADMPTPQRELTKAAILEHQAKSQLSPRAARQKELLKTPGLTQKAVYDESSPMPELPDVMRPPPGPDFSIRPDSSPDSQWFWKMKMEILEEHYEPKSESLKKALKDEQDVTPYAIKRYNFFKKAIPNYNSPNPAQNEDKDGDANMEEAANLPNEDKSPSTSRRSHDDLLNLLKSNERSAISPIPREKNVFKKQLEYDDEEGAGGNNKKALIWATSTQMFEKEKRRSSKKFENVEMVVEEESEALSISENNYVPDDSSPIRILEDLESFASAPALDSSGNAIDFMGEQEESEEPTLANWVFAVSSTNTTEEKTKIIESIQELGGAVDDNSFTYLIMPKLAKSSKYFCALARGNFILHPDFIKDSLSAGKFLNPEDYEYGNPQLKCNTSDLKVVKEVFRGPYICRQAIKMNPEKYDTGLFTGMKFLIVASQEKRDIFSYVITCGGGIVIDEQPEFKAAVLKRDTIDYCLVDNPQALTVKDQKTLSACNITIRNVRFIYEYLLSENLLA